MFKLPNTYEEALEYAYAGRFETGPNSLYVLPTILLVKSLDLKLPKLPDIDLYISEDGQNAELLRSADQPYSPLALSNYDFVLIKKEAINVIRDRAEKELMKMTSNQNIPVATRMHSLRKASMLVAEDIMADPSPENIQRGKKMVNGFVYLLMRDPSSYLYLASLSSHDPYTLQHSVGTAVNSIILGRKLGVKDEKDLTELGLGGLLHDVGKTNVKPEIINKPGPLDDNEWAEMKQHSTWGFDIIKSNDEISVQAKRAVLEHHEDKSGKGYPHGMNWSDVHDFAKIVALCDIFNALTTDRSYSKAQKPYEALKLIRDKMQHKFDDEVFKNMVEIYGGKID